MIFNQPPLTGDIGKVITITILGIMATFLALSLIALFIALIPKMRSILIRWAKEDLRESTSKIYNARTLAEVDLKEEELAMIVAAVTGFLEYKLRTLLKSEIFSQFPALARLLSLAGIAFDGKLKVLIKGEERQVEIQENHTGMTLKMGPRAYKVVVIPPYDKIEIPLDLEGAITCKKDPRYLQDN